MAQIEITSLFSREGVPATDIDTVTPGFPTVRIWEISGNSSTLIVGNPSGTGQPSDGLMIPVDDGGQRDGFYTFVFSDVLGYDPTKKYLIRSYGGTSLPQSDRYQEAIIDSVWNEVQLDHDNPGTFGEATNNIDVRSQQLLIDVNTVQTIVDLLLKYETGRTRIDPVAGTLTVFDDDCVTPLRVFELLDSSGNPSVVDVCERNPISASDGSPVCP
jgi:hypothetical protein